MQLLPQELQYEINAWNKGKGCCKRRCAGFLRALVPFVKIILSKRVKVARMAGAADSASWGLSIETTLPITGMTHLPELHGSLTPITQGVFNLLVKEDFGHSVVQMCKDEKYTVRPKDIVAARRAHEEHVAKSRYHTRFRPPALSNAEVATHPRVKDAKQWYLLSGPIALLNKACPRHATGFPHRSVRQSTTDIVHRERMSSSPDETTSVQDAWRTCQVGVKAIQANKEITITYAPDAYDQIEGATLTEEERSELEQEFKSIQCRECMSMAEM
jgi:hypothetical protein